MTTSDEDFIYISGNDININVKITTTIKNIKELLNSINKYEPEYIQQLYEAVETKLKTVDMDMFDNDDYDYSYKSMCSDIIIFYVLRLVLKGTRIPHIQTTDITTIQGNIFI